MTKTNQWILIVTFIYSEHYDLAPGRFRKDASEHLCCLCAIADSTLGTPAVNCSYTSIHGITEYTVCEGACCEGEQRSYSDVCCGSDASVESGSVGIVLITASVSASVCWCVALLGLTMRRKKKGRSDTSSSRHSNTAYNDLFILSTVSMHSQPARLLPYDEMPPACYPGTDNINHEIHANPDSPPPAYTP